MTALRRSVWITRAEPGASATAARVRAIGFEPRVAPLLTIKPLDTPLDLDGVGAIAFTSANAVKAFVARSDWRSPPVFVVGAATARSARLAGFQDVTSADSEMVELVRLIARSRPEGVILHPCGLHLAGDLVGNLKRAGLKARNLTLYDTPAAKALPQGVAESLAKREIDAVLVHSPRAAEILAGLASGFDLSETLALGFSSACLRPLRRLGFADLIKAKSPREDALLDALLAVLREPI